MVQGAVSTRAGAGANPYKKTKKVANAGAKRPVTANVAKKIAFEKKLKGQATVQTEQMLAGKAVQTGKLTILKSIGKKAAAEQKAALEKEKSKAKKKRP